MSNEMTRADMNDLKEDLRLACHDGIEDCSLIVDTTPLSRALAWIERADAAMQTVLDAYGEDIIHAEVDSEERLADATEGLRAALLPEADE